VGQLRRYGSLQLKSHSSWSSLGIKFVSQIQSHAYSMHRNMIATNRFPHGPKGKSQDQFSGIFTHSLRSSSNSLLYTITLIITGIRNRSMFTGGKILPASLVCEARQILET
jgi:hypothetical protein